MSLWVRLDADERPSVPARHRASTSVTAAQRTSDSGVGLRDLVRLGQTIRPEMPRLGWRRAFRQEVIEGTTGGARDRTADIRAPINIISASHVAVRAAPSFRGALSRNEEE